MTSSSSCLKYVLAGLFLTAIAASFAPFAPVCEMMIKDGANGLQWKCSLPNKAACTNCGVDGKCGQIVVDIGDIRHHYCFCVANDADAEGKKDACYATVKVDFQNFTVTFDCTNECCEGSCPPSGGPFPFFLDPCPC